MSAEQGPKTEVLPGIIDDMARQFIANFVFLQRVVEGSNSVPALFVDIQKEGFLQQTFIAPENQPLYMYLKNGDSQVLLDASDEQELNSPGRSRVFNAQNPLEVGRMRALMSADGGTWFSFYDATQTDMAFELIHADSLEDYVLSATHPAHAGAGEA